MPILINALPTSEPAVAHFNRPILIRPVGVRNRLGITSASTRRVIARKEQQGGR